MELDSCKLKYGFKQISIYILFLMLFLTSLEIEPIVVSTKDDLSLELTNDTLVSTFKLAADTVEKKSNEDKVRFNSSTIAQSLTIRVGYS